MNSFFVGNTLINDAYIGNIRVDDIINPLPPINVEYLVIAAGGKGGNTSNTRTGGGGGAGGFLSGSVIMYPYRNYFIKTGTTDINKVPDVSYFTSSLFYLYAVAGGMGGDGKDPGSSGGSGGGGGQCDDTLGCTLAGGGATSGQGFAGGTGAYYLNGPGGGGGGAGGAGSTGVAGIGKASSISGTSITYAVGGSSSGGANGNTAGSGGSAPSGRGADGIVILRYRGAQAFNGGTVTTDGNFTVHTFTQGTYTITYG